MKRHLRRLACSIAAITAVATLPAAARADFGNHLLPGASGTLSGFAGSHHFFGNGTVVGIPNAYLDVTVDYAVFAPGQFNGSFLPLSGFGAPPSTDYVYAYQIFNNGPLHGTGNRVFSKLSLASLGGQIDSLGRDMGYDPSALDIAPTLATNTIGGVTFYFLTPQIRPDYFSGLVLIASPHAPAFGSAAVLDSGVSDMGLLPIPSPVGIPAPGAALLAAIGLGMIRARRPVA